MYTEHIEAEIQGVVALPKPGTIAEQVKEHLVHFSGVRWTDGGAGPDEGLPRAVATLNARDGGAQESRLQSPS